MNFLFKVSQMSRRIVCVFSILLLSLFVPALLCYGDLNPYKSWPPDRAQAAQTGSIQQLPSGYNMTYIPGTRVMTKGINLYCKGVFQLLTADIRVKFFAIC